MLKKLNEWLDEFVENGADASDITEWPENAGGNIDLSPLVIAKAGMKIKIDFDASDYNYSDVSGYFSNYIDSYNRVYSDDYPSGVFGLLLTTNEAHTQIIATLTDNWNYQSISNEIVIYEGTVPEGAGSLSDLQDTWPIVEFTIGNDFSDICVFKPYTPGVSN